MNLVSQFHLLDRAVPEEPCTPPVFMAFDCVHVHGLDVRGLPLHRRRHMLEQEVSGASMVFAARRLPENGLPAWGVVKERGYEGLVAKDADSTYRGGATRSWIKGEDPPARADSCSAESSVCRTPSAASSWASATAGASYSAAPLNGALDCVPRMSCSVEAASAAHRPSTTSDCPAE